MTTFTPRPAPFSIHSPLVPGHAPEDGGEMTGYLVWADPGFFQAPLHRATWTSPSLQAAQVMEAQRPLLATHSPLSCDSSSPNLVKTRVPSEKSHPRPSSALLSLLRLPHTALATLTPVRAPALISAWECMNERPNFPTHRQAPRR